MSLRNRGISGMAADEYGDAKRPFQIVLQQDRAFAEIVEHEEDEKGERPEVLQFLSVLGANDGTPKPLNDDEKKNRQADQADAERQFEITVVRINWGPTDVAFDH